MTGCGGVWQGSVDAVCVNEEDSSKQYTEAEKRGSQSTHAVTRESQEGSGQSWRFDRWSPCDMCGEQQTRGVAGILY